MERGCSSLPIIIFPGAIRTGVLMLAILEWLVMNWDVLLGAV